MNATKHTHTYTYKEAVQCVNMVIIMAYTSGKKENYMTMGGGEGERNIAGVPIIKMLSKVIFIASVICWRLSQISLKTMIGTSL